MYFFYYVPIGINARIRKFPFMTVFYSFLCAVIFAGNRYFSSYLPLDFSNFIYFPGQSNALSAITSVFLHVGYVHLLGNLVYLLLFGRYVEDRMGPALFALIFFSAAWVGNFSQGLFNEHVLHSNFMGIIGASGAISGILGAFAVRFFMSKLQIAYWVFFPLQAYNQAGKAEVPAVLALALWFLLQAAWGLLPFGGVGENVAYVTHITGFLWGVGVALMLGQLENGRVETIWQRAQRHLREGEFFAAQGALIKFLSCRPEDGRALAAFARASLLSGDRGQAAESYKRACEVLLNNRCRGEAEDVYREALRGFVDLTLSQEDQLNLAFGLERNLKPSLAIRAYENFERRYPLHAEAPFALLRAANLYWSALEDYEKSRECYEKLVNKYPDDTWVDFAWEQLRQLSLHMA